MDNRQRKPVGTHPEKAHIPERQIPGESVNHIQSLCESEINRKVEQQQFVFVEKGKHAKQHQERQKHKNKVPDVIRHGVFLAQRAPSAGSAAPQSTRGWEANSPRSSSMFASASWKFQRLRLPQRCPAGCRACRERSPRMRKD